MLNLSVLLTLIRHVKFKRVALQHARQDTAKHSVTHLRLE